MTVYWRKTHFGIMQGILHIKICTDCEMFFRLKTLLLSHRDIIFTKLFKALYIGNKLGLKANGVAVSDILGGQNKRDIRELLTRVRFWGLVLMKSDPTYLEMRFHLTSSSFIRIVISLFIFIFFYVKMFKKVYYCALVYCKRMA